MNGFTEPLPGLLDDPQLQIPNLPSLPDVHIAPLRNPAPSRHGNAPLPLEPFTKSSEDHRHGARNTAQLEDETEKGSPPRLTPSDVLSAREAKKPHLAISELLETSNDADTQHLQLPSFVSLAVVEKSPIQEPSRLSPHKRLRLDLDVDLPSRGVGRRLPKPAQKDGNKTRPVPLLPAMVTGLHEPPPSAGILPSMELDVRPNLTRSTKSSKMQVKDILTEARHSSTHVPPEAMLNTPDLPHRELTKSNPDESRPSEVIHPSQSHENTDVTLKRDPKARRARRKWSDEETADLLAGVKKHGFGKWKQILNDAAFTFLDRTSIDLKDRYRVFVKDQPESDVSEARPPHIPQIDSHPREPESRRANKSTAPNTPMENIDTGKTKRKRRPWTPAEDAALIRGVSKHGFQWTLIHDDLDLDLGHRRATDLRDRIRNLYPDGYKQAEARPSRSEAKKADKSTQDYETAPTDSRSTATAVEDRSAEHVSQEMVVGQGARPPGKLRIGHGKAPHKPGGDVHPTIAEQVGVTLPSLALDNDNELDWGNNTLPPLIEWEEIGI